MQPAWLAGWRMLYVELGCDLVTIFALLMGVQSSGTTDICLEFAYSWSVCYQIKTWDLQPLRWWPIIVTLVIILQSNGVKSWSHDCWNNLTSLPIILHILHLPKSISISQWRRVLWNHSVFCYLYIFSG